MNVISRLIRKPVLPPDRFKSRKANIGDVIVFVEDTPKTAEDRENPTSQYWPHLRHEARVVSLSQQPQQHRRANRIVYEVLCQCGVTFHPRSTAFELKD